MNSIKFYESKSEKPNFIFLEKVKELFITIIEKERINNNLKISLSNIPDLNLRDFFSKLDINQKGFIDAKDIEKYLKDNCISFKEQTIRRFIHQFDKNQRFRLIFGDFSQIFKPYMQNSDNQNENDNKNNNSKPQDIFLDILKGTFELIEKINEMTSDIIKSNNFTSYEAFMGITKGNKYLDEELLNYFLDQKYNKDEIKHLIYFIDLNNDSLISYEEFQELFTPINKYPQGFNLNNNFNYNINNNRFNKYNSYNNYLTENKYEQKYDNGLTNNRNVGRYRNNDNFIGNKKKWNSLNNSKYFSHTPNNKENIPFNKSLNIIPENDYYNQIINYNYYKDYDDYINKIFNNKQNNENNNNYLNENNINKPQYENNNNNNEENYKQDYNNENNNNNYYENENEDDYNNNNGYYNFYIKTKEKFNSPLEYNNNNDINFPKTPIKTLQNKINFNSNEPKIDINRKNSSIEIPSYKDYNKRLEKFNKKNSHSCKNIKKNKNFITYVLNNNNNIENNNNNNFNNKLNIIHSEMQYLDGVKIDDDIENQKNDNINSLDQNKRNVNNLNYNYHLIDYNRINIKDYGNRKPNANNINIYDNNNYHHLLPNEKNNNIRNMDFNNNHNFIQNNDLEEEDNNKINDSYSDRLDRETLNKKLKEYNNSSLKYFVKYIQFLVAKEKKTIDSKDKLCLREDITLKGLFYIFDYNKKNCVSKNEFKSVCRKLFGLYPTSDQIFLVFKRYDKNKDNNLNLRDFLGMIKPLKEEYASFLFNKKSNESRNGGYQKLSSKSKKLLIEVVRGIIEDEGDYYKFKEDIINKNLFDLNELWDIIYKYSNNNRGLSKMEMSKLLMNNGITLTQYDLDIIYNKLDYDDDQIISYQDLTQEFVNYC